MSRVSWLCTVVCLGCGDASSSPDAADAAQPQGVLLNRGNGDLAPETLYDVGAEPGFVTAHDLDGNGRLDLLVANHASNTVSVLLQE